MPPQQNLGVAKTPFGQLFPGFSAGFDVVGPNPIRAERGHW
jgi:hypothetical protein